MYLSSDNIVDLSRFVLKNKMRLVLLSVHRGRTALQTFQHFLLTTTLLTLHFSSSLKSFD